MHDVLIHSGIWPESGEVVGGEEQSRLSWQEMG